MKFDIETRISGQSFAHRALMRAAIGSKILRSRAGALGRARVPGTTAKGKPGAHAAAVVTPDLVPDFDVVVILERLPSNLFAARLRWFLGDRNGTFPVVSAADAEVAEFNVLASMDPHLFDSEFSAIIAGAKQSKILIDQFFEWATQGV